jgi:hypothetical protein
MVSAHKGNYIDVGYFAIKKMNHEENTDWRIKGEL